MDIELKLIAACAVFLVTAILIVIALAYRVASLENRFIREFKFFRDSVVYRVENLEKEVFVNDRKAND